MKKQRIRIRSLSGMFQDLHSYGKSITRAMVGFSHHFCMSYRLAAYLLRSYLG